MADINALPKEILDHVISFMDDSTQLVSRLASTQWFKQIRYSDFQLTKIRDEHLEAVATRLSQYDRPISLTFHNSPRRRLANIIGALTKLTNVESLTLGRLDRQNNEKDWLKMTCLTNLKYFSAEGLIIPTAFYLHMTWLRNFSDNGLVPLSAAKQIFQSLPNIDSVHYYPNENVVDAFELVKSLSRLTKLAFAHPECETMNEENTKALANLKVFRWGNYYSTTTDGNQMPLRHMTRLEDLQILVPFRSITSTHLTRIVVSDKAIESLVQNYSKLNNLKTLDVRFEGEVESFNAALESFTALEELCLSNCPSEGYCSIYNLVKSTNLTSLELQQWRPTVPLTLTTLTALVLGVDDPVDCSLFSNLVNLTSLQNYSNNMRGTFPSSITKLRDLSWTDTHQVQLDLSLLPHLEYLDIVIGESNALAGLERATNLKSLTMNSPSNTVVDFKFLSSLTLLQNLSITYIICQNFWPQLRGLTNLRTLAVPRMEREDQILYLTNMGKLREFTTMAQYVAGIHLTRLTSLQSLSFKSDMAARSVAVNSLYKALTRLVTHNF